ncbi:MAG: Gfo/Idh/MocA family oxidoreductase [Anaerolineae bacterium]|nr:Gfo/Idh/MocA family oxidoreductase [Anaerolineae bacterium]
MKRYALAGASSRALSMYAKPIVEQFPDTAQLVDIFDINPVRAAFISQECGGVPTFQDFDEMLQQAHPDVIIVTTVDRFHEQYTVRSLEAGCDVITEKPMAITDEQVRSILDAEKRTGHKVTVTFNYRFAPYATRIKELLREGIIGKVLSVDFEWFLDTSHGADYFRRWHRRKENSGGLLVHKATHHFDIINWWIEDEPERVYAFGERRFYGPTREERGERCSTCPYADTCEFYVDYKSDPLYKALYFDAEHVDGYHRDGCVFSEEIDIEDTMSVTVHYKGDTLLSYSLIAYSPYEGWRSAINGTDGRIEISEFHSGLLTQAPNEYVKLFNRKGELVTYEIPKARGAHGGGDVRLLERLFSEKDIPDPLGHMADSWAGAMSVLIGVAANKSIASGQPIDIRALLANH